MKRFVINSVLFCAFTLATYLLPPPARFFCSFGAGWFFPSAVMALRDLLNE